MYKILSIALLSVATHSALAAEAYCTKFGSGQNKPIQNVCKVGDIIEVSSARATQYCDFSKQILKSQKDEVVCQYVGYVREFRSRVDGKLSSFVIDEK